MNLIDRLNNSARTILDTVVRQTSTMRSEYAEENGDANIPMNVHAVMMALFNAADSLLHWSDKPTDKFVLPKDKRFQLAVHLLGRDEAKLSTKAMKSEAECLKRYASHLERIIADRSMDEALAEAKRDYQEQVRSYKSRK